MAIEDILGISGLIAAAILGVGLGWFTIILPKSRAEQNIERLLKDAPGREDLAELILRNPNSENIQRGRELIIGTLESLSPKDRREISSGLYQDSIRGRANYTAKLITRGCSNHLGKIPTDEKVTA